MVIGSGLIANLFSSYVSNDEFVVFASGVSNSRQDDQREYQREENLLSDTFRKLDGRTLVYFGTCRVYDPSTQDSFYVRHKLAMEKLIASSASNFQIFRFPQLVGRTNSPTLVKILFEKIRSGERFDLWEGSQRNLVAADDAFKAVDFILRNRIYLNMTLNLAAPRNTSIRDIVEIIGNIVGVKPIFNVVSKGGEYNIPIGDMDAVYREAGLNFSSDYIEQIIRRIYGEEISRVSAERL